MLMAMVKQSPVRELLLPHPVPMDSLPVPMEPVFITQLQGITDLNPKILPTNPYILFNLKNPTILATVGL